jgi:hypothetical protein
MSTADHRVTAKSNADEVALQRGLTFTPPPLFIHRTVDERGKRLNAREYYESFWQPLIAEGHTIYSDDLRNLDKNLYDALASALNRDGEKISSLLKPSPTRGRVPDVRTSEQQEKRRRQSSVSRHLRHYQKLSQG